MSVLPSPRTRDATVDVALLALLALLPLVWRAPFQDTPFIDDWCYAWSVEHLLAEGEFRILEFSSSPLLTQTLWGALFAAFGGFSFTTLRISTWVAAVSGLIAFYLLLRDLGVVRRAALIGVATLAAYPIFAVLSITYMTDVPFLALTLWAVWATNRAVMERRTGLLAVGAVLMALAAGVRTVAVVLPIATALTLLLHTGGWGRQVHRLAIALSPLLAVVALHLLRGDVTVVSADMSNVASSPANRVKDLPYAVTILPEMLISTVGSILGIIGIALLPVTLSVLRRGDLLRMTLIGAAIVLVLFGLDQVLSLRFAFPLDYKQTWSLGELGATEQLVSEDWYIAVPAWVPWAFLALGVWSSARLFQLPWRRFLRPDLALLAWFCFGYILLSALLWLNYDRYFLILVPFAIAAVLATRTMRHSWLALAVVVLIAGVSLASLRDHLTYNATLWQAVDELRAMGVADADIDGGYIVNGWLQYARPEKANRDETGQIKIPMVNATSDDYPRPYLVADRPRDDRPTLRTLDYRRILGLSGSIYVLGPRHSP